MESGLAVSYNKVGEVLLEQGNLPAALDRFTASFANAERVTS
jgi:hypothetical protein